MTFWNSLSPTLQALTAFLVVTFIGAVVKVLMEFHMRTKLESTAKQAKKARKKEAKKRAKRAKKLRTRMRDTIKADRKL